MDATPRAFRGVLAAAAAAVILAGCGGSGDSGGSGGSGGSASGGAGSSSSPTPTSTAGLFADDFKGVCSGATQSRATPYDATGSTHKVLWFATYQDGLLDQSSHLPADWTVAWAATGNPLQAIDLVGCAVRTGDKFVKTCTGYKDHGKDTGNTVRMHTATYDVSVREAATGKLLKKSTVAADDTSCPMIESFDSPHETVDEYASIPDDTVNALLKKYVQP